jgi:cytochrome oxidase assembly protein ShyY1
MCLQLGSGMRECSTGPRVRSAMGGTIPGKIVVTPVRDEKRGAAALVVRGWAPTDWRPAASPSAEPVSGQQAILRLL